MRSSLRSIVGQFAQFGVGLASVALLTRWVSPADYGLVGMASVLTGFLGVLGDSGVSAALIRRPRVDKSAEATAFWITLAGGTAMTIVCAAAAPDTRVVFWRTTHHHSSGFARRRLSRCGAWACSNGATRERAAIRSRLGYYCGLERDGASARGPFGSARGRAMESRRADARDVWDAGRAGCYCTSIRHSARESIGGRGEGVCVLRLTTQRVLLRKIQSAECLDNLVGGRWIGASGLGLVGMAIRVFVIPIGRLCCVVSNVFLPTITGVSDQGARTRAFAGVVRLTALLTFPISIGAAVIAPEIEALLPSRWTGVADPLRIFALGSVVDAVSWYSIAVLIAFGRARALLSLGVVLVPISWGSVLLGSASGRASGLATAWVTWNVAQGIGLLWLVSRDMRLGREFWYGLLRPLSAATGMAVVVWVVLHLTETAHTKAGALVGIGAGATAYVALALIVMRGDVVRLGSLLRPRAGERPAAAPGAQ